nr:hypothetical protein [Tanacetum cinerariifolium]
EDAGPLEAGGAHGPKTRPDRTKTDLGQNTGPKWSGPGRSVPVGLRSGPTRRNCRVWSMVWMLSRMDSDPCFEGAVEFLIPVSKVRSARSIISRIILVAICYFIWQKRYVRLFKKKSQ